MKLTVGVLFETTDPTLAAHTRLHLDEYLKEMDREMHAAIQHRITTYFKLEDSSHPAGRGITHYTIELQKQPWTELPPVVKLWLAGRRNGASPRRQPAFAGAVLILPAHGGARRKRTAS